MKTLISTVLIMTASTVSFATESITIKTPRGADVNVTLHIPQGSNLPAIVVAPGQSCNSKGPLFETLGQMGASESVAIVRFEWNYCNSNPSQPTPSPDLKNEIEDFQTVLEYIKSHTSINKTKIILAGKSLGSLVSYAVFAKELSAKALVLLTPVCSYTTDENGKPLPEPMKVCEENYPKIKDDSRPVLMTMGNLDSLCILSVLYDFLKDSKGNIATFVAGGDHGFRIKDSHGNVDQVKTQKNINTVVSATLNWIGINL
jgi:predicted alpha/beta-hydrolase family hydrolase